MTALDNRLTAAFELCRSGVKSVDVGCDHARLAAALSLKKNCRVIASDLRDGPLKSAERTLAELGATAVETVKSDGLDGIDFADDVIICGMGGELIADIAERCRFKNENTRFIVQPMTKADVMRRRLCRAGFEIIEEKTAVDDGRVYSVMLWRFTGISREICEIEALCGKNRDGIYLETVARKLRKNARNMAESSGLTDKAERLIRISDMILGTVGVRKVRICEAVDFLNEIAPFDTAQKYDNVGLLVGDGNDEVSGVCCCLDVTHRVIAEAAAKGANLIISHHPVIFGGLLSVPKSHCVWDLIDKNIAVIAAHTNFDTAHGGVNDTLVGILGFTDEAVLDANQGYGAVCALPAEMTAEQLAEHCRKALGLDCVRFSKSDAKIRRAAVCCGAGIDAETFALAREKGCGAIISGDIKHNFWIDAENCGMTLIDAGHYGTEIPAVRRLADAVGEKFPQIAVFASESEENPCGYCI